MNTTGTNSNTRKNIVRVALGTALVLLIPAAAMQFADQVNWDETDFITMGVLLFGTGLTYVLLTRALRNYRVAIGVALLAVLIFLWVELAVGVFTNWGS